MTQISNRQSQGSVLLTLFKMSTFDRFVIWTGHAVWGWLLLLLLVVLVVPILRLIVVVLIHSVHVVVLHVVAIVATAATVATHVLTASTEALEVALVLHATSAKALVAASRSWSPSPYFPLLLSKFHLPQFGSFRRF